MSNQKNGLVFNVLLTKHDDEDEPRVPSVIHCMAFTDEQPRDDSRTPYEVYMRCMQIPVVARRLSRKWSISIQTVESWDLEGQTSYHCTIYMKPPVADDEW